MHVGVTQKLLRFRMVSWVLILVLGVLFVLAPQSVQAASNCGTYGMNDNNGVCEVSNCDQLMSLGQTPDSAAMNRSYILTQDFNCPGDMLFTPIGTVGLPFTGTFNGNNKTISHLRIDVGTDNNGGLFGYTSDANISNLTLDDTMVSGDNSLGSLVGTANGQTVINKVQAINGNLTSIGGYNGGLVGQLLGTAHISYSSVKSSQISSVSSANGGLVGGIIQSGGVVAVRNSYASDVTVTGSDSVGGLVGFINNAEIDNVYANSTLHENGGGNAGGLVGALVSTIIRNAYATGTMNNLVAPSGGLVGNIAGLPTTIENSFADITGDNVGGGFIGTAWPGGGSAATLTNNFYTPNSGSGSNMTCYAGDDGDEAGCTTTNSPGKVPGYWLDSSHQPMASWNISTIWNLAANDSSNYPVLLNEGDIAPVAFDGGDGQTDETAYLISTCQQLQTIGSSNQYLSLHYKIHLNDIDCSDSVNWHIGQGFLPIGNNTTPFTGVFDGNGFAINHLTMNRADNTYGQGPSDQEYVGLFGKINNATVRHLTLNAAKVKGWQYVGGISGYAAGSVINDVSVNPSDATNDCDPTGNGGVCVWARFGTYGGGITGYSDASTITNVTVGANVKGSGQVIGGIVGYAYNTVIESATSHADVDGGQYIGGLVGNGEASDISNSLFDGNVNVVEEDHKTGNIGGGIAGEFDDGSINNTTSSGDVTGNAIIGGLVGITITTDVTGSIASGNVTAFNDQAGGAFGQFIASQTSDTSASGIVEGNNYIGGFVGQSLCGSIFTDVSESGDVNANQYVGGFSGFDGCEGEGSTFTRAHASGNVTSTSESAGGFIGYAIVSTLNSSFAVGNVTAGGQYAGGLVGYSAYSNYTQAYSTGSVATTNMNNGGLVGSSDHDIFSDVYATGDIISDTGGGYAGGLIGKTNVATIDNAYSSGLVQGWMYIGGLIGNNVDSSTQISNSFTVSLLDMPGDGWIATPSSFVGVDQDALTYSNDFYNADNNRPCAVHEEQFVVSYPFVESTDCTGVSVSDHPRIFKRSTDLPLSSWDFAEVWSTGTVTNNGYPCFKWQNDCTGSNTGDNSVRFISPQTNKDITLQLSAECTFEAKFKRELDQNAPNDVAYDYPNGLVGFNADCGQPGFTTTVTQYYYDINPASVILRKYNPTTKTYFTITDAQIDQTTLEGKQVTRVRYQVKDGSDRDADGKVDGKIADPAGLAVNVVNTPNTGFGGIR